VNFAAKQFRVGGDTAFVFSASSRTHILWSFHDDRTTRLAQETTAVRN